MPKEELHPDFVIGNLATDLVDFTLEICNKDENKNPRFPKRYYASFVTAIIDTAVRIQECVCVANVINNNQKERKELQDKARGLCTCMEKLVFSAYNKKWISAKQFTRWQKLICALHWGIYKWTTR